MSRLTDTIIQDLTDKGFLTTEDMIKAINVSKGTWYKLMNEDNISELSLRKLSYLTKRPILEYKELIEKK